MKKLIYVLLSVFVFNIESWSQTYTWFENFNNSPEWTLEQNWSITGGKLEFYWSPQIPNFDLSAISPSILLPDNVNDLTITQYIDVFSGTGYEFAEIRLITDGNPVSLWNYNLANGNWGNSGGDDLNFDISGYAGHSVQIEFRTYGNDTFNWNWWHVFEVKVSAFFDYDLTVLAINGPSVIGVLETGTWTVDIKNLGSEILNEFSVELYCLKTGDLIGSVISPGNILPQQTQSYNFDWSSAAAFNTAFFGVVTIEGDQFDLNNVSESRFVRIEPDIDYNILVWDNDNGIATVVDPDKGDEIEPSKGLTRALDMAGFEYDYYSYLPDNLYDYEIIFSTMGCFCVS